MISKLYPQLPLEEIEEKVGEIQLADYLLVEKYIPNYISPKDDIAIRCNQIIDNLFYYYDIDDVYTQVSDVQKIINHRLSLFANSSDFLNRKNQI